MSRKLKKIYKRLSFIIVALFLALAGCSSSEKQESQANDSAKTVESGSTGIADKSEVQNDRAGENKKLSVPAKMVIYQAELHLKVKNFDQTVQKIEKKAAQYGGYIAESNVTREGKEQISGMITIRIPQKNFQQFLTETEGEAAEVLQRNITGEDVTEEYVDLKSRLKSKRVVEDRLLTFMKNASKTEDLLRISNDLAAVQEEIETIEGKMKYLEKQTSYSTVTITLYENKVVVPDIDKDKLNTWEKTKQQFMKSTNLLLAGISGLVVFIFGNLPILALLFLLIIAVIFVYKKHKNKPKG